MDRTGLDTTSSSEGAQHKMEGSASITGLFHGPSLLNLDVVPDTKPIAHHNIDSDLTLRGTPAEDDAENTQYRLYHNHGPSAFRSASRSSTVYADSLSSASVFSQARRTDSISSNGSHPADSNASNRRNFAVTYHLVSTENLSTTAESPYIEADDTRLSSSLPTLASFPPTFIKGSQLLDNSSLIELTSMGPSRSPRDTSPDLEQSPPKHPLVSTLAKRHQTFPLSRTDLKNRAPTAITLTNKSAPAQKFPVSKCSSLVPEKAARKAQADGSSVANWLCETSLTLEPVDGCFKSDEQKVGGEAPGRELHTTQSYPYPTSIEVGNQLRKKVPLRIPPLATFPSAETTDTMTDTVTGRLLHAAQQDDKHDKLPSKPRWETSSASSRDVTVKNT